MKKSKIIVPALGILVLSTAAAVTGTVAWFTSSNIININGLQMRVEAEDGIVMSNEGKTDWETTVAASHSGADVDFMLTSSANLSAWFHANSDDANESAAAGDYTTLEVAKPDAGADESGIGQAEYNENVKNVYLLNRFWLQSASGVALEGQDIYVKDITITGADAEKALNRALRVAFLPVVADATPTIYGPIANYTPSYTVHGQTAATTPLAGSTKTVLVEDTDIAAFTSAGTNAIQFEVYCWFEGEDAAAKSANITAELDNLAISFKFGNEIHH